MKKILFTILLFSLFIFVKEEVYAFSYSNTVSFNTGGSTVNELPIKTWVQAPFSTDGEHSFRFFFNADGFLPNSSAYVTHSFCVIITNSISGNNVLSFTADSDCPNMTIGSSSFESKKLTLFYNLTNVTTSSNANGSYPITFFQDLIWDGYPYFMYLGSTYCLEGSAECESLKAQQEIQNEQKETNEKLDNINDSITNDEIDSSAAGGFFGDYEDNDYGLSSIITAPLQFIQNLNNNQCSSLTLPLPYVDQNLTLPCMTTIYSEHFGSLFTLYQAITTGFIAYWVSVRIFALVKGFKDPEDDKIEVMDL